MINLNQNVQKFFKRKLEIEKRLSDLSKIKSDELTKLSKELAEVNIVTNLFEQIKVKNNELDGLEDILKDKQADSELKEIAKLELKILHDEISVINQKLELALLPKDKDDETSNQRGAATVRRPDKASFSFCIPRVM